MTWIFHLSGFILQTHVPTNALTENTPKYGEKKLKKLKRREKKNFIIFIDINCNITGYY